MRDTLRRCAALLLSAVLLLTAATGFASTVSQDEWSAAVAADAETFSETEGLSDEWWNVLLLGCDSYTKNDYQRTDSMIIVSINAAKGRVKLTSLMRDTWIPVPGSSSHRKLTELCAVGGPELTIRAINESFGMNISDYALISMEGMAEIIDLIGGLDLDVTEEERKALNKGLFDLSPLSGMEPLEQSGEGVHLNGNQATAFARIRKIDSDYVRTERQRTVLLAIADKIKNGASAGTLLTIVTTLMGYVDTNLSLTEIMTIASVGMKLDMSSVEQYRVPVDGTFDSGTFNGVWCIKPNFEKNTNLLHSFIYEN
ncbi:MAG: LCP family protein [Clostridia bacterium]|nr:LCP family protein [Clostridia bacterium]